MGRVMRGSERGTRLARDVGHSDGNVRHKPAAAEHRVGNTGNTQRTILDTTQSKTWGWRYRIQGWGQGAQEWGDGHIGNGLGI